MTILILQQLMMTLLLQLLMTLLILQLLMMLMMMTNLPDDNEIVVDNTTSVSDIRSISQSIEMRDIDIEEVKKVDAFLKEGCGCQLYSNKWCCLSFSRDHICCIYFLVMSWPQFILVMMLRIEIMKLKADNCFYA